MDCDLEDDSDANSDTEEDEYGQLAFRLRSAPPVSVLRYTYYKAGSVIRVEWAFREQFAPSTRASKQHKHRVPAEQEKSHRPNARERAKSAALVCKPQEGTERGTRRTPAHTAKPVRTMRKLLPPNTKAKENKRETHEREKPPKKGRKKNRRRSRKERKAENPHECEKSEKENPAYERERKMNETRKGVKPNEYEVIRMNAWGKINATEKNRPYQKNSENHPSKKEAEKNTQKKPATHNKPIIMLIHHALKLPSAHMASDRPYSSGASGRGVKEEQDGGREKAKEDAAVIPGVPEEVQKSYVSHAARPRSRRRAQLDAAQTGCATQYAARVPCVAACSGIKRNFLKREKRRRRWNEAPHAFWAKFFRKRAEIGGSMGYGKNKIHVSEMRVRAGGIGWTSNVARRATSPVPEQGLRRTYNRRRRGARTASGANYVSYALRGGHT
ncbi:hypothetical protein C8J57DRAFT_1240060 [Mycena rebaudengoi]|nr:hypothetical protein C8J57DRAFT_1240060 [Mycena rebaudengoi]